MSEDSAAPFDVSTNGQCFPSGSYGISSTRLIFEQVKKTTNHIHCVDEF